MKTASLTPLDIPEPPPLMRRLVPSFHPLIVFTVLFAVSLICTPFVYHWQDTEQFWVPWMKASRGLYPWEIYRGEAWCNYPPFCLYLLTILERIRIWINADPASILTICLVKIPFLMAHLFGVLVCYYGLRRPYGGKTARRVALLYALCIPLFVNGALWGQADTLMMLAMVCCLVLLANDKPIYAGAAIGWALSIKFQSVVIVPMLLLYTFRRFGLRSLLLGIAAGLGTLLVLSLPFVIAGVGKPLLSSYTDAAGYYPLRSLNAMNLWGAVNTIDMQYRHLNGEIINNDRLQAIGPLNFHHLGLLMFGSYLLFLLIVLWRRPNPDTLFFTCALGAFGLFVLATQMHERYVVPGVALLALPALFSLPRLLLYAGVCLTAGVNEIIVLYSNYYSFARHGGGDWVNVLWGQAFLPGSLLNCALLALGTYLLLIPPRTSPKGSKIVPSSDASPTRRTKRKPSPARAR